MSNISYFAQQKILDALNLGSTTGLPAAASGWWVALSTGSPVGSASAGLAGEPGTINGYTRQSCRWGVSLGSSNVAYSAFNTNAMTFGPFSSILTLSGIGVIDSNQTAGIGNPIWFGLLATPRPVLVGDQLILAASALTSMVS